MKVPVARTSLPNFASWFFAGLCIAFTVMAADPPTAAAGVEARKVAREAVIGRSESVRAVFAVAADRIVAVASLSGRGDVSGAALVVLDGQMKEVSRYMVPAPRPPDGMEVRRTSVEGAVRLSDGDLLLFGHAEIAAGAGGVLREGWAARMSIEGAERWSRIWPATAADAPRDEYLYFAVPTGNGAVLIGGKRQAGADPCRDAARGVAFEVDALTGALRGERRFYGTSLRQGFRAAAVLPDGGEVFAGWVASEDASTRCRDDAWLLEVSADRPEGRDRRYGGADSEVLIALTGVAQDRLVFSGYSAAPGGQSDGLLAVVPVSGGPPTLARAQMSGPARWEAGIRLGRAGAIVSVGTAAASTRARDSGWVRFHGPDIRCGDDIVVEAAGEIRLIAVDALPDGTIVVAGLARRGGAEGGWVGVVPLLTAMAQMGDISAGVKRALIGTTSAGGGAAPRGSVRFKVGSPTRVRVTATPLVPSDILLTLRPAGETRGASADGLHVVDWPWAGPESMERVLEPGEYLAEVASSADLQAVRIEVAPAASLPAGRLSVPLELRPLAREAMRLLGLSAGATSDGDDMTEVSGVLAASDCGVTETASLEEQLALLSVLAAKHVARQSRAAVAEWHQQRVQQGAVRTLPVASEAGERLGEVRFAEIPGTDRLVGEVHSAALDRVIFVGELSIAVSDRLSGAIRGGLFTPVAGNGIVLAADGVRVVGKFAGDAVGDFAELEGTDGVVYRGAVSLSRARSGTPVYATVLGVDTEPDGTIARRGTLLNAMAPCPGGQPARRTSAPWLACPTGTPRRLSGFSPN